MLLLPWRMSHLLSSYQQEPGVMINSIWREGVIVVTEWTWWNPQISLVPICFCCFFFEKICLCCLSAIKNVLPCRNVRNPLNLFSIKFKLNIQMPLSGIISKNLQPVQEMTGLTMNWYGRVVSTRDLHHPSQNICTDWLLRFTLTIRLIRKNCENVIYFAMTYFIIVYILSIS
jgi:hypothetical protein